jgi:hypothetical protein
VHRSKLSRDWHPCRDPLDLEKGFAVAGEKTAFNDHVEELEHQLINDLVKIEVDRTHAIGIFNIIPLQFDT